MVRTLTGTWKGEYAYDQSELAPGSWGFEWTLRQGLLGGLRGKSQERNGERLASLRGRFSRDRIKIRKIYPADPWQFKVMLPDGSRGSAMELFGSEGWSEYVRALADGHGVPVEQVIESLAREMTAAARTLSYVGTFVSIDRMEGAWNIGQASIAWAGVHLPETTGTWWASRSV